MAKPMGFSADADIPNFTAEEREHLETLEELENLTEWEVDFIVDIRKKGDQGLVLSEPQADKLRQIYEDRYLGGEE